MIPDPKEIPGSGHREADVVGYPPQFARRYREAGYWTGQTFPGLLARAAREFADRPAITAADGRTTSYAQLAANADALARGLAGLGVGPGMRVVVQLPNRPEFFDVIFALFRLHAWPVFALPAHRATEIEHLCRHTGAVAFVTVGHHEGFDHRSLAAAAAPARTIVADPEPGAQALALRSLYRYPAIADRCGTENPPEAADHVPAEHDTGPEDGVLPGDPDPASIAFLQLSGGSTGMPKLIPRTHDDYLYSVRASNEICAVDARTVYLCALPVAHNFTMSSPGVLGVLIAGGRVVLAERADPDTTFALMERERVTHTAAVPPLAQLWLDAFAARGGPHAPDLSSLAVLLVGGARLAPEVAARVAPVLGCRLQQVFGMAEGLVNYTRLDDPDEVVVGTQGRPISADDEVLVVDEHDRPVPVGTTGNLLTRGPYTIRGYWRAEAVNATTFTPEGFYRTGDLVRVTAEGNLVVEGRSADRINRGGEKVVPAEVEDHLLAHPAVHDAALVGVPDPYLGERTCAVVVLRAGDTPRRPGWVRAHLRARGLAGYKIPDVIRFVPGFPVTGVGKISRRQLRELLRADVLKDLHPTQAPTDPAAAQILAAQVPAAQVPAGENPS